MTPELTRLEQLLATVNDEGNQNRIKLATLTKCYNSLAQSYHEILFTASLGHHKESKYTSCNESVCKSNFNILKVLGLGE